MTPDPDREYDVDYWRNILNAIDRMLTEVLEQHITISSYAMDLTNVRTSTEPPLPGGDRTVITGPWAREASHGDDTPHPRQTIIEWCERLRDHRHQPIGHPRFAEGLRYLRDQTPWILESPFSLVWREDITAVHGRLRVLCPPEVDDRHDSTPLDELITEEDLWEALAQRPDHELTRRELKHLGIPASTVTTWRHRGKIAETRPGRYRAGDILNARRTA